jgi:Flp pilus assembly secretin CpaC
LKEGEWAVAAGLLTKNESRNITGLAGIAQTPILGRALSSNGRDTTRGQTLLVLRPRIISPAPSEQESKGLFTGSETRYLTPVSVPPKSRR